MSVHIGLETVLQKKHHKSHGVKSGDRGGNPISPRKDWHNQCFNNGRSSFSDILINAIHMCSSKYKFPILLGFAFVSFPNGGVIPTGPRIYSKCDREEDLSSMTKAYLIYDSHIEA